MTFEEEEEFRAIAERYAQLCAEVAASPEILAPAELEQRYRNILIKLIGGPEMNLPTNPSLQNPVAA